MELRNIPVDHLDFTARKPHADYADIVTVAMLQSYSGSGKRFNDLDYSTVTAFERLGLDYNIDSAEAEDLSEDMEAAMRMLS